MKVGIQTKILFCLSFIAQIFMSEVLVGQSLDSLAYSIDLDDVVISGQYGPTHYTNAMHQVDIIKQEEFIERGFTQLDQVLTMYSSARVDHDPILGSTIKLRGIESNNVAILQDGVPLIGRLDGALDLSQISLTNIERIEIVEGPQSVLYGNNAAGGVINLISKKSQLPKIQVNFNNQVESTGLNNHELKIGANLGPVHVALYSKYLHDQFYQDDSLRIFETFVFDNGETIYRKKYPWNPKDQFNVGGLMRMHLKGGQNLMFRFDRNTEEVLNFGELRRLQYLPYAFDERYKTHRSDYAIHYKKDIKDHFVLNTILAYNNYVRMLHNDRFDFESDSIDESLSTVDSTAFDAYFGKLTLASKLDGPLNYIAGVQYNYEQGKGGRLEVVDSLDYASSRVFSVFADGKYKIGKNIETSLGARWTNHSNYGNNFSPSIQTKWNIASGLCLRAGFARGFRSPELKELFLNFIDVNHYVLGNEELIPEITNDYNLSLSYDTNLKEINLRSSVKWYKSEIHQKIILIEYETAQFQYTNLEDYSVTGVGTDFQIQYKELSLSNTSNLGFWYNSFSESTNSPKYNRTFDMSNTLGYKIPKTELAFSVAHRHIGKLPRYYMDDDTVEQSITAAYNLLDASVSYSIFKNTIHLVTGVRNLINIQRTDISNRDSGGNHALDTNTNNQLVGKGRTFFVGLSMEISK